MSFSSIIPFNPTNLSWNPSSNLLTISLNYISPTANKFVFNLLFIHQDTYYSVTYFKMNSILSINSYTPFLIYSFIQSTL